MRHAQYFLRDHAFFCLTSAFCYFLDVKRDRYICLDAKLFHLLGPYLHGWRIEGETSCKNSAELPPDAEHLADVLVLEGILSTDSAHSRDAKETAWKRPTRTLLGRETPPSLLPRLARSPSFFKAALGANRKLRRRSIEHTIGVVAGRKQSQMRTRCSFDEERTMALTSTFNAMRNIFPRDYLCLFDSLALIDYLADYGLFPSWVFGIRPEPFGAHCWVQADDVVLNDTVEHACQYIPIMAI